MAYRELSRALVQEVVRRWRRHERQRGIACATGLVRVTVCRYVAQAERPALSQTGPPPNGKQLVELAWEAHRAWRTRVHNPALRCSNVHGAPGGPNLA